MHRVEHESAVTIENLDPFPDLAVNLRRCPELESLLGVGSAAPESELPSKPFFEHSRFHPLGGTLNGIQDVKAGFNDVGQKFGHATARMNESFPSALFMNKFVDLDMKRLK